MKFFIWTIRDKPGALQLCFPSTILLVALMTFSGCKKEPRNSHHVVVHAGSSIQAAVDAASSYTIIFIEPGIYKEAIVVDKPGIQLVGTGSSKHGVIIDNPGEAENGITVRDNGDRFVLKNITIQNFEENGLFMIRVDKFLLSHVETINNGEYGLFPLFCHGGIIDHCSATGHTDTGIYVGQSEDIIMEENVAFANVNGLEIENCTNVAAFKNDSYDNVCGILVVLLPGLTTKTSSGIQLHDNYVHGNNHVNFADPSDGFEAFVPSGSGVLVVGVDNTTVTDNKISGNNFVGVAVVSSVILGSLAGLPPEAFADIEPNADSAKIAKNLLTANGSAAPPGIPIPAVDLLWDGSGINNCWIDNSFSASYPTPLPVCN